MNEEPKDKFCVDCKHHQDAKCMRAPSQNERLARWLVHGIGERPGTDFFYCQIERLNVNHCGPTGKFWEPKQ